MKKFFMLMTVRCESGCICFGQAGTDVKKSADDTGKATDTAAKDTGHATDFFVRRGTARCTPRRSFPANDPTLLFTNAGMNQFKDVFPRPGEARLLARHHVAEVRARRRQAQRPRKRGLHQSPPHVLRDAGQLQLRRLLQEGRHRLRVGADHLARVVWACRGQALRHHLQGRKRQCARRRSLRILWLGQGVPPSASSNSA
jgi:hypothetical protein